MDPFNKDHPENFNYHYKREERLASMPENVRTSFYGKKKKFFFDRRTLLLLVAILLVAGVYGGITVYEKSKEGRMEFAGCRLELAALVYDNRVLASLKAEALEPVEPGTILEAVFYFQPEQPIATADLLPVNPGEVRYFRAELPVPENPELPLQVSVTVGDQEMILSKIPAGE